MEQETAKKRDRAGLRIILIVLVIIALVIIFGMPSLRDTIIDRVRLVLQQTGIVKTAPISKRVEEKVERIVEEKMSEEELKTQLGESLDHVVRKEEPFRVRGRELSVAEILRSAGVEEATGNIYYGVKVIKAGDYVWLIHHEILREFFRKEGVELPPLADKPDERGYSSGVGKILKYDEKKAYVYNIKTNRLRSGDINLIYPGEEIVFFSMKDVFSHLKGKELSFLDRLHFDGQHLYIIHSDGSKEIITPD